MSLNLDAEKVFDPKNKVERTREIISGFDPQQLESLLAAQKDQETEQAAKISPDLTNQGQNVFQGADGVESVGNSSAGGKDEKKTTLELLGIEPSKNLQQNIERTKRTAKMQKYGEVFNLLAQTIGAFNNASVPQINNTSSQQSAEALRRLNAAAIDEEQRNNMFLLQEKIRNINKADDRNYEKEQYKDRWNDRVTFENERDKREQEQRAIERKQAFEDRKALIGEEKNLQKDLYKFKHSLDMKELNTRLGASMQNEQQKQAFDMIKAQMADQKDWLPVKFGSKAIKLPPEIYWDIAQRELSKQNKGMEDMMNAKDYGASKIALDIMVTKYAKDYYDVNDKGELIEKQDDPTARFNSYLKSDADIMKLDKFVTGIKNKYKESDKRKGLIYTNLIREYGFTTEDAAEFVNTLDL